MFFYSNDYTYTYYIMCKNQSSVYNLLSFINTLYSTVLCCINTYACTNAFVMYMNNLCF